MKYKFFTLIGAFLLFSCNSKNPQPVKLNTDNCDFCKMTIANAPFATQLITDKGRCYKFDDVSCMIQYQKENETANNATLYVANFANEKQFILAEKAFYLEEGTISSPMQGNTIALSNEQERATYQKKFNAQVTTWNKMYAAY